MAQASADETSKGQHGPFASKGQLGPFQRLVLPKTFGPSLVDSVIDALPLLGRLAARHIEGSRCGGCSGQLGLHVPRSQASCPSLSI
jgi:hypothetical protein